MCCLLNHVAGRSQAVLGAIPCTFLFFFLITSAFPCSAPCNFPVQLACDVLSDGTKSDNAQAQLQPSQVTQGKKAAKHNS